MLLSWFFVLNVGFAAISKGFHLQSPVVFPQVPVPWPGWNCALRNYQGERFVTVATKSILIGGAFLWSSL